MDRNILINFVVIICILVNFTSSLHITGHRSRPQKKSFLDGCLDEINRAGKKINELTRSEFELLSFFINKKIDKLNSTWKNKYLEERKTRFQYQALFDFTEKIEEYFVNCWPSWAGHRPKDSHKQAEYATLFLNIEKQDILNIRIKISKFGLSIEKFIKNIARFQIDRNTFASQTLKDDQIIEAYHHFTQRASHQACQVVCALLTQADQVSICKALEIKTNIDEKKIKTLVDKERENHVLLWFSELLSDVPTITETDLIQVLISPIIKKHKLKYPMAYVIHRNKKNRQDDFGCVLFNRFDDAFKLHKATAQSNSTPLLKKSQIFDVVNSAPYKWAIVQVQVTNNVSVNDEDGLKKDVCQIFNDKGYPKWKPSNIYATKTENSIICKFASFRHAMVGYQLLKNKLESSNSKPIVTFHISDSHDPGDTLLQWFKNELEEDKDVQYFNFD